MIACPNNHSGTFIVKNTVRQAIGVGTIRVSSDGAIVEVVDPASQRVDLRCDECSKNFSIYLPSGRRALPFATETVIDRTVLDEELNTPEPVIEDDASEDEHESDDTPQVFGRQEDAQADA